MKKVILVNLLVLACGLALLELSFGSWFSDTSTLYDFIKPRNVHKTRKTTLPGQPEISTYTVDQYGFRGLDKGLDEIFMVTVGGSTTDQKYIDDNFTYEAWLQKFFAADKRDVDIVSAGIDGQSTYGHLKNFPYWFAKLPGFAPRYILYYAGVNDFYILQEKPGFDAMTKSGTKARFRKTLNFVKEKSALYAAGKIIASLVSPPDVAHFRGGRPKPFSEKTWTTASNVPSYRNPKTEKSLEQLRQRIAQLAQATRNIGATPVFVTQRSVNWIEHDGEIWGLKTAPARRHADALDGIGSMTGVDYYWLERMQAQAIMGACREAKGVCIDLAGNMAIDHEKDFYDAVHTTPSGSKKIAGFLYPYLKDLP